MTKQLEKEVHALIAKAIQTGYNEGYRDGIADARTAPKMVIYESNSYANGVLVYDMAICPACNHRFEDYESAWGEPFCPHCGQALEWNITEDKGGAAGEND